MRRNHNRAGSFRSSPFAHRTRQKIPSAARCAPEKSLAAAPLPWRADCLVTIMLGPTPGTNGTLTPAATAPAAPAARGVPAWGEDGFTFGDLIDVVNPLQHIPFVSWAYRALTGDKIAPAAKVDGGTLFGGPLSLALSAVDATLLHQTGRDTGSTVVALLTGKRAGTPAAPDNTPGGIAVAARTTPAPGKADATPTLSDAQMARLLNGLGQPPSAPPAVPLPAWQQAAATLPQDQVALLLRSVGLPQQATASPPAPATVAEIAVQVAPTGTLRALPAGAMPALPVQPVVVADLLPPTATAPVDGDERARRRALDEARANGDEIRRLFAQ